MKASGPRIAVVGAGIVGASIAYHLARRGAAVTLVDKGGPAGDVTGRSFAWINVSHGLPEPYFQLRHLAIREYHRLEQDLGHALRVDWCGALTWNRELAETERMVREHAAAGYDIRLVERDEIARLEPNLIDPPDCAAYAASEGAVEPVAAAETLVHGAGEAGAEVRLATEVLALGAQGRRITGLHTSQGTMDAEVVVVAAGTGTRALCAPLGVALPIDPSPALLLRFRSPRHLVNRVISNPDMEIRQGADGHLFAAEDFSDGADPDAIARSTLAVIKDRLRGADALQVEDACVGWRPMPADGFPVVGFSSQVDGLYVAAMHAGVTMAPAVGSFAATEILDGVAVKVLEPCRLERFAAPGYTKGHGYSPV